jgi:hypothetical protein
MAVQCGKTLYLYVFSTIYYLIHVMQMNELYSKTSAMLQEWVDMLPNNESSPARPWSGIVANANTATRAHHDVGDNEICMVLIISDCKGGALVLHELGLVFDGRNGDASIFQSVGITHYNLDFVGVRGSLVFHNDRAGVRWAKDANGWVNNTFFMGT